MLTDWSRVHSTFLTCFSMIKGILISRSGVPSKNAHSCSNNPHFFLTDPGICKWKASSENYIQIWIFFFFFIHHNESLNSHIKYISEKKLHFAQIKQANSYGVQRWLVRPKTQQISCFSSSKNNVQPVNHIRHWLQRHTKKIKINK